MEKYESKQVQIRRPAALVYNSLSDFSRFTPIVQDKVEEWEATADECSFMVKGFSVTLRIVEREENRLIKIVGEDGSPIDFTVWFQMQEVADNDTRMRLVAHIKLNMMMKMMIGGKIQGGLDNIVDQIAYGFNNSPY